MHGWASREDGVYATDDGGATWRLAYPRSAVRVALVSPSSGMIAVGDRISRCGCRQVRLWTADGGGTWTRTPQAVGSGFAAAAGTLWWWRGASLYRAAAWPPGPRGLKGIRVAHGSGAIVEVEPVPGGAAALVSRRVGGFGFDRAPLLRFAQNGTLRNLVLPRVGGDVLVRSFEVEWPADRGSRGRRDRVHAAGGGVDPLALARRRRDLDGDQELEERDREGSRL